MLTALLLAFVPMGNTATENAHDLATLTEAEARKLEGRDALFIVDLDSRPGDCVTPDDVNRTLWLRGGPADKDVFVVRATFKRIWRPSSRDSVFPGFWEWRLDDARR